MILTRYAGILTPRMPITNYNLLTKTQRFDDAAWTKVRASVTANAVTDPFGGMNADKLTETATTGEHGMYQMDGATANGPFVGSIYAKAAERTYAGLLMSDFATGAVGAIVNLSDGTYVEFGNPGSWTSRTVDVTNEGSGWWRMVAKGTRGAGTYTVIQCFLYPSSTHNDNYLGIADNGYYVFGAHLETGSTDHGYQEVN